tara:strand:- start:1286 stop:1948 length:663 start_codon:yes stop_codon:yes gene_type:complete
MFVKKYYNKYKKVAAKPKIKDDKVFETVNKLLELPWMFGGTKDFLISIKELYEKHGELTKNQIDAINRIKEKNSQETAESYNKWVSNYDEEKREIASICALYYKNNPPYFSQLAERIFNESDFVPSEKQYKSMCENKFTKKVIEATKAEAKYPVGTVIRGRKNAPINIRDSLFSVIKINATAVQSAAKGAKMYELLPFGKTHTIFCEERYLKKINKSEAR